MPSLNEAVHAAGNMTGYEEVSRSENIPGVGSPPLHTNHIPTRNSMLRCPLPPLWADSSDAQRQFYIGGNVPQIRVFSPRNSTTGITGTPTQVTVLGGFSGMSSGMSSGSSLITSPTASPLYINSGANLSAGGMQQTTAITSVLSPNGRFAGSIAAAKGSQIISVAVGSPCRVQLYGNAQSQTQDAARGLDVPPQAGTTQGIVTDVVLDTAPYVWTFQNCVAVNADSPQKPVLYVTLTNLDTTSDVITLALRYVPIESV